MRRGRDPAAPRWTIHLFWAPAMALFIVFFAIPTLQALQYALTDWDGYSADFNNVGAQNFVRVLTGDSLFRNALINNAKFLLVVLIIQTVLSLILAMALIRNTRTSILLRALYFFPTILSSVSVAFIWKFVYDPTFGLANGVLSALTSLLQMLGLDVAAPTLNYLGNDATAIYWVALAQCWAHIGQMMVVFVAGLQQVPRELYEAAALDGAGALSRFIHVTLPQTAPALTIVVAYTTIQSFKAFDLILGMSGIPPKQSMDILSTRIYTTFTNNEYGYAAAQSLVFMAVIAAVTFVQRRGLSRLGREDG